MIILLAKKTDIKKSILQKIDNIQIFDDLLDLQLCLSKEDNECDILMINISQFHHEASLLAEWLSKSNSFIKHTIFYYTEPATTDQYGQLLQKMKQNRYHIELISKKQLLEGLKKYEQ